VSDQIRRLYDFELEPEVRDWLYSLSDSNFRRVDEVCGLLAEKGSELGGPQTLIADNALGTAVRYATAILRASWRCRPDRGFRCAAMARSRAPCQWQSKTGSGTKIAMR
jgi:hypothetical protein